MEIAMETGEKTAVRETGFLSPFTPPAWEYVEAGTPDSSICPKCNHAISGLMSDHIFDAHINRSESDCVICYRFCNGEEFKRHLLEDHPNIKNWDDYDAELKRVNASGGDPDHHEDYGEHG